MAFGWSELDALGSLFGGIFTALAFGGTLWILVREGKQIRKAEERLVDERRDDESRQARLVHARVTDVRSPNPPPRDGVYQAADADAAENDISRSVPWLVEVAVENYSDGPIHNVEVTIPEMYESPWLRFARVPPGETRKNEGYGVAWATFEAAVGCGGPESSLYPIKVVFTDNAGRQWSRLGLDQPSRELLRG